MCRFVELRENNRRDCGGALCSFLGFLGAKLESVSLPKIPKYAELLTQEQIAKQMEVNFEI